MVSHFGDGDCGAGEPGASACAFRPPHNPRDYSQFTLGSTHLKFDFWPQPKTLTNIYSLRSFLMIVLYDTRYFKTCFKPYDNLSISVDVNYMRVYIVTSQTNLSIREQQRGTKDLKFERPT